MCQKKKVNGGVRERAELCTSCGHSMTTNTDRSPRGHSLGGGENDE